MICWDAFFYGCAVGSALTTMIWIGVGWIVERGKH